MATLEPHTLPRIAITFCTQCRWMLRAAYYSQELLSTFSTSLGEVALIPATGGTFNISITYIPDASSSSATTTEPTNPTTENSENNVHSQSNAQEPNAKTVLLWDRKADGGFPETKVLKQRVRDCIEPGRNLGHSDVGGKKGVTSTTNDSADTAPTTISNQDTSKTNDSGHNETQACGPDGC